MKEFKLILIFLFTLSTYFLLLSSCESKSTTKFEIDKHIKEEQKIAHFLTTSTELNSKLLAVTDLKKSQGLPNEYLQLFTKQQQVSYSYNEEIDKIATSEMVSIPSLDSDLNYYDKYELTKEQQLDTIIDNLILQVALLKTMEKQTSNEKIVHLTTTYLPRISSQIELTNTFKINNYLTN